MIGSIFSINLLRTRYILALFLLIFAFSVLHLQSLKAPWVDECYSYYGVWHDNFSEFYDSMLTGINFSPPLYFLFNFSFIRNRFIAFREEANTNIELNSKEKFFVSKPIALDQKIKHKRKLVLFLFVDGLADRSILGIESLSQYMPNTARFFERGFDFRNHHVNSEWTLPSFASILFLISNTLLLLTFISKILYSSNLLII